MTGRNEGRTLRTVEDAQGEICYELVRKKVKNVNLRVRPDGSVTVSANLRVSLRFTDEFVRSKAGFIRAARQRYAERAEQRREYERRQQELREQRLAAGEPVQECTREEFLARMQELSRRWYPPFRELGVPWPQIRIRKMTSRWGSCHTARGIITYSTMLAERPEKAAEYVVVHEFAHFLVPNHSARFYETVASVMPDWRERKELLRQWGP